MDISQATSYIASQKQIGVTDIDIAQALVRAGWPEIEIQKAFAAYHESLNPKAVAKKPRKKGRGLVASLIIVFVLGLVGGGGAWAYTNNYLDLTAIGLPPIPVRNLQAMFDQMEVDFTNPAFDYEIELNASEESDEGPITSQLQMNGALDARNSFIWSTAASFIVDDPAQEAPFEFFMNMRTLSDPDVLYAQVPGGELLTLFGLEALDRTWLAIEIDALDESAEAVAGDVGDLPDVEEVATGVQQSLSQMFTELAAKESFSDVEILADTLVEGNSSHHYRIGINNDSLQAALLEVLRAAAPDDTPSELVEDAVFEIEAQLRTLTFSTIEVWLDVDTNQFYRIRLPFEYREVGTTEIMTGDFYFQATNYGNPREVVRPTGEPLDAGLVLDYMSDVLLGYASLFAGEEVSEDVPSLDFVDPNTDYILSADELLAGYEARLDDLGNEASQNLLNLFDEAAYYHFVDFGTFDGLCADFEASGGETEMCQSAGEEYIFVAKPFQEGDTEAGYWCTSSADGPVQVAELPEGYVCES